MISVSLPLSRQRRYDVFLALVPVGLVAVLVASWALPIPLHASVAAGSAVVGVLLLGFILRHPPRDSEES